MNANIPMTENIVKTKLRQKQPVLGVLSDSPDPAIAELCGILGLDFYMIDGEHGAITAAQVPHIVRACEVSGITPLARVGSNDPKQILSYLDAGVMGIMMPGLSTVPELEALVRAIKYPPAGNRGFGLVRANNYMQGPMNQADYVAMANDQLLILPQIEDYQAVENLEALCRVEGIDGFVVGPRDLAMSMGYYDGMGHNEVKKAIAGVVETVLAAGLVIGTTAATGDQARALIDRGVLFCLNTLPGLLRTAVGDFTKGKP